MTQETKVDGVFRIVVPGNPGGDYPLGETTANQAEKDFVNFSQKNPNAQLWVNKPGTGAQQVVLK